MSKEAKAEIDRLQAELDAARSGKAKGPMVPTLAQGTYLAARADFSYVNPDSRRKILVKRGSLHWIGTPEWKQKELGSCQIIKKGKKMGDGPWFQLADVPTFFEIVPET